ncbi:VCBS repeat-containing protein [Muricauda sp. ANG21]|uniref:FG-GAP repeat domain-containing protein n=1 Tax=Allomuricauda sp. ANG21 TaxID=3042468 RepID=UPI00345334E1
MSFMFFKYRLFFLGFLVLGCGGNGKKIPEKKGISDGMFDHAFITTDLPGEMNWGYGCPALADFDNDGDLDYAFTGRDVYYWFENRGSLGWYQHVLSSTVGPIRQLGSATFDVDGDGWEDVIAGGFWYRNTHNISELEFERYVFDESIDSNIHDVVVADMNQDGKEDLVLMGEAEGVYWYNVPESPSTASKWSRTLVTLDVLVDNDHIHSGFFPRGIGDLDGDGDNDLVLPDRWMENGGDGKRWKRHPLPFGKRGPFGLSSRSWIIDLDRDGDQDIVMTDSDQKASRAAWLENDGSVPPNFTTNFLPMSASGIRGSFHSLYVGDFDNDGDSDIFTCDQEDETLLPEGASPRWYIWENIGEGQRVEFVERVILDNKIGGHDALVGDIDGDTDLDICSKVWHLWKGSGNHGIEHGDILINRIVEEVE